MSTSPSDRQFRDWSERISRIVREMEETSMVDATPVLCATRAAQYIALATVQATEAPRP